MAVLLAGCAQTEKVWVRDFGNDEQAFYMDRGQCQAQAYGAPGMYTTQVAMVFASCMRGKGWYLVERPVSQ